MIDPWYLENLVCPVDGTSLEWRGGRLVSEGGNVYAVVDGIPVMLCRGLPQTQWVAEASLRRAWNEPRSTDDRAPELYLESLGGISDGEKQRIVERNASSRGGVDPVVAYMIGATCGIAYRHKMGNVQQYPIPDIRLPRSNGARFLDIGCNWGRWSIAAAELGYSPVGIDPSLGAIMAARRVARQLGANIRYVVGDARMLPFRREHFGVVFSYSVLQHFSKDDARQAIAAAGRVLEPGGISLVQMANKWGIRSLQHQARRRFQPARAFEVRYWSVTELQETFDRLIGPSTLSVDCFFGLGLQQADIQIMQRHVRAAIRVSEALRRTAARANALVRLADSVYVRSIRRTWRAEMSNGSLRASTDDSR